MRLVDRQQHLVADLERQRAALDVAAVAGLGDLERVDRQRVAALEQERLGGLLLELQQAAVVAHQLPGDLRVDADQMRLPRLLGDVAELAQDLDRDGLGGANHALAVAGRALGGQDLADAVGDVLAGHLDQPERRDLDDVGLRPVLVEGLAQRLQDLVAVLGPRHVDEVDDDDPADVAEPELADDLVGGLDVDLRDRVLEPALALAGEAAGVDVHHRQCLGVVDDQVAAGGQIDPARQRRAERLLGAVTLEQVLGVRVHLDRIDQLRGGPLEERGHPLELLLVVDLGAVELAAEDVAEDADRKIRLLEDQRRRVGVHGPPLEHLVQLVQVGDLALEVLLVGALGRRPDDVSALLLAGGMELLEVLAHLAALAVGEPAADPDPAALRHVDEVAAGDRELHRQARSLRLQRVLDDLDDDLLTALDQLVDPPPLAAAALRHRLAVGGDDLVDVEEAVALEPDVDEGRLHPGQHVVDDSLVDVADDRARSATLDVELADPPVVALAVAAALGLVAVGLLVVLLLGAAGACRPLCF